MATNDPAPRTGNDVSENSDRERVLELLDDIEAAGLEQLAMTPDAVAVNAEAPTDRTRGLLKQLEAEGQVEQVAEDLYRLDDR